MRLIAILVIAACNKSDPEQTKAAPSTVPSSKPEPTGQWRIELEVNGDANCDPQRRPEAFVLVLDRAREQVESTHSISIASPRAWLAEPFHPTAENRAFLEKAAADLAFLDKHRAEYDALSVALFKAAFGDQFPVASLSQVLVNVETFHQQITHTIRVDQLVDFQTWFFDKLVPKIKGATGVEVVRENGEPILPLLIYGPVTRTGTAPKLTVMFDPAKTILTMGAQNEANDTTLCQLRTGVVDAEHHPTADIPVHRVIRVAPQ